MAGLRSIRGLSLLLTLLCFFCFARATNNTVTLEMAKERHQEATERMKNLRTSHKKQMDFYHGWTGEFKRIIDAMRLEDEEFSHSPLFTSFLNSSMQRLKELEEYAQNLESQIRELEEELEQQGRIIKWLEGG